MYLTAEDATTLLFAEDGATQLTDESGVVPPPVHTDPDDQSGDLGAMLKFQDNNDGQFYEVTFVDDGSPSTKWLSRDLGADVRLHNNGDGSYSRCVVSSGANAVAYSSFVGGNLAVRSNADGSVTLVMVTSGAHVLVFNGDLGCYVSYTISGGTSYTEKVWVDDGTPGVLKQSRDLGSFIKMHDNGDGSFSRVVSAI